MWVRRDRNISAIFSKGFISSNTPLAFNTVVNERGLFNIISLEIQRKMSHVKNKKKVIKRWRGCNLKMYHLWSFIPILIVLSYQIPLPVRCCWVDWLGRNKTIGIFRAHAFFICSRSQIRGAVKHSESCYYIFYRFQRINDLVIWYKKLPEDNY